MRFVTYNIQYGKGRDGHFDLRRIADAVREADVIALQEVERYSIRSGTVDQASPTTASSARRCLPRLRACSTTTRRGAPPTSRCGPSSISDGADLPVRPVGRGRAPTPRTLLPSRPSSRGSVAAGQGPRIRGRSWRRRPPARMGCRYAMIGGPRGRAHDGGRAQAYGDGGRGQRPGGQRPPGRRPVDDEHRHGGRPGDDRPGARARRGGQRARAGHGQQRRGGAGGARHRPRGGRAGHRRLPLQRPPPPREVPGLRPGARQVPDQPRERRAPSTATRTSRRSSGSPSTTASRSASASTGAAWTSTS